MPSHDVRHLASLMKPIVRRREMEKESYVAISVSSFQRITSKSSGEILTEIIVLFVLLIAN